jgi:cytoskeleton protein RodZ
VKEPEASKHSNEESLPGDLGGESLPAGSAGPPPGGVDSFGPWLRRQREIREIDLQEIADRTKISVRYLKAMEQDRFDLLPGTVFARGFLREYARYVGLNPDEVVNFYLSTRETDESAEEEEAETARQNVHWGWIVLAVLLLAAMAAAWFLYFRAEGPLLPVEEEGAAAAAVAPAPPPVPEESLPTPEPERAAATAGDKPLQVTFDFAQDCWVALQVDGEERIERYFVQGESLQLAADERVDVFSLGNAGGVAIQVNGEPFPLNAESGEVRSDIVIDLATARRQAERGP